MSAEETIRQVVTELANAWNIGDMKALSSLFAEDGHYVTAAGLWLKGRAVIERELSKSRPTADKKEAVIITGIEIKFLKPDVALVHNTWEMAGDTVSKDENPSPRKGLFTMILIREKSEWLIAALHNTDLMAAQ